MSHDDRPKNSPVRSAPDGVDLLGQPDEEFAEFDEQNERQRTNQTAGSLRAYLDNRGGGRVKEIPQG